MSTSNAKHNIIRVTIEVLVRGHAEGVVSEVESTHKPSVGFPFPRKIVSNFRWILAMVVGFFASKTTLPRKWPRVDYSTSPFHNGSMSSDRNFTFLQIFRLVQDFGSDASRNGCFRAPVRPLPVRWIIDFWPYFLEFGLKPITRTSSHNPPNEVCGRAVIWTIETIYIGARPRRD